MAWFDRAIAARHIAQQVRITFERRDAIVD